MPDQAPNIEFGKGKLVYDKERRTIVAVKELTMPTTEESEADAMTDAADTLPECYRATIERCGLSKSRR